MYFVLYVVQCGSSFTGHQSDVEMGGLTFCTGEHGFFTLDHGAQPHPICVPLSAGEKYDVPVSHVYQYSYIFTASYQVISKFTY